MSEPGVVGTPRDPPERSAPSDDGAHRPRTNAELRDEAIGRMTTTAMRLVAERGAARLSLVDVGRESGYSHSLPNYYFGSKKGLLLHVYRYIVHNARDKIRNWYRVRLPGQVRPGMSSIGATVRGYLCLVHQDPTGSRAMHVLWSESISSMPELIEAVRPMNRRFVEFFDEELRFAIERGEIDADVDVEALSLLLAASVRGVVAQYMVDPERVDLQRVGDALLALLERGVGARRNVT